MPTITEVVNRALVRIGAQRINTLEDEGPIGDAVRDVIDEARQSLIRAHPWNFAIRVTSIAPHDDPPPVKWLHRFRKPTGGDGYGAWLRTIGVWEDADLRLWIDYRDEGYDILADPDLIYVRYVADIVDANLMDPLFREALMYRLAAELAVALTNSNKLHADMVSLANDAIARARSIDAMDDPPLPMPAGSWEMARWSA